MQFTGDARYGDWIERLFYNGVGAALPLQAPGATSTTPTTASAAA